MAYPTLHKGSSSSAVKWVQLRLGVRPTTGYFGKKTRAAVMKYQKAKHLKVSGWVTAPTWRALGVTYKKPVKSAAARTGGERLVGTAFGTPRRPVARSTARGAYYRYGGRGPKGFDCSGFVGYVLRKSGKTIPRTASG